MRTISIDENGIWAGTGQLTDDNAIENCSAILGGDQNTADRAYDAIQDAISNGQDSATVGDYTWTWDITD